MGPYHAAIEPRHVLDALQKRAGPFNSNTFFHDSVPVTYRQDYLASFPRQRIISTTLDNIEAFARGAPQNVVSAKLT